MIWQLSIKRDDGRVRSRGQRSAVCEGLSSHAYKDASLEQLKLELFGNVVAVLFCQKCQLLKLKLSARMCWVKKCH